MLPARQLTVPTRPLPPQLIFEATSSAVDARSGNDSGEKSALKMEAMAENIAWQLLTPDRKLLIEMAIADSNLSWLSKADSTISNKIVIGDLIALNPDPKALFHDVLSPFSVGKCTDVSLPALSLLSARPCPDHCVTPLQGARPSDRR